MREKENASERGYTWIYFLLEPVFMQRLLEAKDQKQMEGYQ